MKLKTIITAAVMLTTLAGVAQAKTICGVTGKGDYNPSKQFEHVLGSCAVGGRCVIFSVGVRPELDEKQRRAEINFMIMNRLAKQGPWEINYTISNHAPDISDGFEFTVDKNETMRIPYEFLQAGKKPTDGSIDKRVTSVVMEQVLAGQEMLWKYSTKDGKPHTMRFRLGGIQDAVKWFDCAQKPAK